MYPRRREWSLDNSEDELAFQEMLDEIYGDVKVAGMEYATSHILENIDEVAYRTFFNDWSDNQDEEWQCSECMEWYSTEEEAEACCKKECEECGELYETQEGADNCHKEEKDLEIDRKHGKI